MHIRDGSLHRRRAGAWRSHQRLPGRAASGRAAGRSLTPRDADHAACPRIRNWLARFSRARARRAAGRARADGRRLPTARGRAGPAAGGRCRGLHRSDDRRRHAPGAGERGTRRAGGPRVLAGRLSTDRAHLDLLARGAAPPSARSGASIARCDRWSPRRAASAARPRRARIVPSLFEWMVRYAGDCRDGACVRVMGTGALATVAGIAGGHRHVRRRAAGDGRRGAAVGVQRTPRCARAAPSSRPAMSIGRMRWAYPLAFVGDGDRGRARADQRRRGDPAGRARDLRPRQGAQGVGDHVARTALDVSRPRAAATRRSWPRARIACSTIPTTSPSSARLVGVALTVWAPVTGVLATIGFGCC